MTVLRTLRSWEQRELPEFPQIPRPSALDANAKLALSDYTTPALTHHPQRSHSTSSQQLVPST